MIYVPDIVFSALFRGASIEHLVHYLIEDPAVLWSVEKGISKVGVAHELHTPSERKITEFFLVMMKSYVDPLIFLRLLLHRYANIKFA